MARLARLHRLHAFLEAQEAFAQGIEPGFGLVGQFQTLAGTAKQHHAKHVLECANLLSHGRGGYRQLVGRTGKGEVPRGGIEHAQGVQRQVRTLHGRSALLSRGRRGKLRRRVRAARRLAAFRQCS